MEKDIFDTFAQNPEGVRQGSGMIGLDYNGDGIADAYAPCPGGAPMNAGPQVYAVDYNGDGIIDGYTSSPMGGAAMNAGPQVYAVDYNGDGIIDGYTSSPMGGAAMNAGPQVYAVDYNGDGIIDGYTSSPMGGAPMNAGPQVYAVDYNGDGIIDGYTSSPMGGAAMNAGPQVYAVDYNGDGIIDGYTSSPMGGAAMNAGPQVYAVDYNGDGIIDGYVTAQSPGEIPRAVTTQIEMDRNRDGIIDHILLGKDTDGDGCVDFWSEEVDTNYDGVMDGFRTVTDMTHEGIPGYFRMEAGYDLNGDNLVDEYTVSQYDYSGRNGLLSVYSDPDGDHIWEAHERYYLEDGIMDQLHSIPAAVDTYETFDPAQADMSRVIGNPQNYMDNWHLQETSFSCAVASQEFIIEELLGISLEEAELRRIAVENGWLSPDGTNPDNSGKLMEYMGLEVRMSFDNTFEDLCACLERGGHPLVGVDAQELWNGQNEELYMPGEDANHAIQVIGVDLQDPENPMVILNDPGVTNGCGAMVPADLFIGAWEDSGCRIMEASI